MNTQRLDKFLSTQLNISRKDIKLGIRKGLSSCNDLIITDSGYLINPDNDKIMYNGQAVKYKKHLYILINKPKGVLSASTDKNAKTVIDLLPDDLKRNGLFPVGRLDKDTTGLLIITDDGEFAHKVLSPKKNIYKTYIAELDGIITPSMQQKFESGIIFADGTKCKKGFLKPLDSKTAEVKICEGKFHQIKRMFGVLGLGVNELKRVSIGNFHIPISLMTGKSKELSLDELITIFD